MRNNKKIEFSAKKVTVVGLGSSGIWTARFLAREGANVTVSEIRPETDFDPDTLSEIRELGIRLEMGEHRNESFLAVDMIILSPGVPLHMPLLRNAIEEGIPVMGELELGSRLVDVPMIAVTGTNGKSTVTTLLGRLIEDAGFDVFVGGNIGTPLMAYVTGAAKGKAKMDYIVVEVSSFQLDAVDTFCPFVSFVLNISPDHLDRYSCYEDYVQSKLRIFANQGPGQFVILNDDDEKLSSIHPSSGVSVLRYGAENREGRHGFIERKRIMAGFDGMESKSFSLESVTLPGLHNLENVLAAVLGGLALGIDGLSIQNTIDSFKGLPDRLELVKELDGVAFYNDSKATNVDAAVKAVKSFDRPLILIAGGRHKGADYAPLVKAAEGKAKRAIFMGEAGDLLASSFRDVIPFSMAIDMDEAVSVAFSHAKSGDAVLLAPACSSFDMFTDYSHRGRAFRSAVERIFNG